MIYILTINNLFSLSFTPCSQLVKLKNDIGGVRTLPNEVIENFGNNYESFESDVYGVIPNTSEGDIIITYDYSGLKYLFFSSNTYDKFFLYYWEIEDNDFIEEYNINFGMSYSDILDKFGEGFMNKPQLIGYYFDDGGLFFEFRNKSLVTIYWSFSDDM